jgi:hypothetical protein
MPKLDTYLKIKCGLLKLSRKAPAELRFWRDIDKSGPCHTQLGRCWIWKLGPLSRNCPYGQISVKHRNVRVHKFSWVLHHGEVPAGLSILHKCDTPLCVNPDHLFLGTQKDNQQDMVAKGRENRGEGRPQSKLTEEQVMEIRRLYVKGDNEYGTYGLARKYGVHQGTIWGIVAGRRWGYLQ